MKLRLAGTTAGLAIAVTAAVLLAFAAGAWLYSRHHYEELLESARRDTLGQGELIRDALEHQMIENDRSLIARMVEGFGRRTGVERVMLLDRQGRVQFSSAAPPPAAELRLDSATCQACHRLPPAERGSSRVIETSGGTLLRTVIPFRNREACHGCHDPRQGINGIMILDRDTAGLRASLDQDLRRLVLGTGAVALVLIGVLAVILRLAVLRRLQRFETTARLIAGGELERRVPAEGSDTIAWLAREFNAMADSVTGLVSEVRSQGERLETILNSVDDGIVVLDRQRTILAANDAFLRRLGRSRAEVFGLCCRNLAPGACTAPTCPTLSCLGSGQRQVQICERRQGDGPPAWEEVHASPVLGPDGRVEQVVEVWRDISERRRAEARLAESHRLASLGLLASGFSHELNTPLATVLTCVEGILRAGPPGENAPDLGRIRDHAGLAREQVLRCRGITQHFLRLARGQAAPLTLLAVAPLVSEVVRLIAPTAREHGVAVEVGPVPASVYVRADEPGLQHALINLLLNAVQACSRGARVQLTVEAAAGVRIRVADEGCGIPAEHRERIFEPFYGLRRGGTGLGLFLAMESVRRFGGDIVVSSTPGRGSTFEVVLPAPDAVPVAS